jgi:beta-phosphoglucomutase-like phosphatase (HAD superfamily)
VPPRECVVIEDTLFGISAARDAGMRVIGFTGGAHTWPGHADVLTEAGAETVINRFADLPATAEALMEWDGMPD